MSDKLVLWADNFELYLDRNDINPTLFGIYCEADRRVTPILRNYSGEGDIDDEVACEDEGPTNRLDYTVTSQVALDRLNLTEFTLHEVSQQFDSELARHTREFNNWNQQLKYSSDCFKRMVEAKTEVTESLSLDKWIEGFKIIFDNRYEPMSLTDWWAPEHSVIPLHIRYMLSEGSKNMYGFPTIDCRSYLRAVLEAIGGNKQITLDLTDMVHGESIGLDQDMCSWSRRELAEDSVINHKIIVLTEGKTDKFVLEGSLRLF